MSGQKNEPKRTQNEAGKLLIIRSCGKNEPKNEPGHVVDNKRWLKNEPEATHAWIMAITLACAALQSFRFFELHAAGPRRDDAG